MSGNPNPTPIPNLVHVRRAQKAISTNYRGKDLSRYLDMPTFVAMARELGKTYFPATYRKNLTLTMAQVEEVYRIALVLFPYIQKMRGVYRPSWHRGTFLSWFRRGVSSATHQFYFQHFTHQDATDPAQAAENARVYLGIEDADFLGAILPVLDNVAHSGGRKAALAQAVYFPLAFAHIDQGYRETTRFDAIPRDRAILRAKGEGTASYIRKGRDVYILASKDCAARIGGIWVDLRDETAQVLDYRLAFQSSGQKEGVNIDLVPDRIDDLIAAVKAVLAGTRTDDQKIYRINNVISRFAKTHQYASGSGRQLYSADSRIYRLVRKEMGTHYPQFKKKLWSVRGDLYTRLVLPITNPFLEPETVSDNTWMSLWNSYR